MCIGKEVDRRESAFHDAIGTKIQLTWEDVFITAPPKKPMCKKIPEGAEDKVILGT